MSDVLPRLSLVRTATVVAVVASICLISAVVHADEGTAAAPVAKATTTTTQPQEVHTYPHITVTSTMAEIFDNPAFAGFSQYMGPTEDPTALQAMRPAPLEVLLSLANLHAWNPQTLVDGINFVVDQVNAGKQIWYPLYTAKQIAADESKKAAGLWFFPGDPNKPIAVVAPGGGFVSAASIQEGFPYAQKLHELGYNVAILKYRVDPSLASGATTQPTQTTTPAEAQTRQAKKNAVIEHAKEDVAAAMKMLRDKAHAWHLSLDNYSVWGSSAGGEVMTAWASKGAKANGFNLPTIVVGAYTPPEQIKVSSSFPPYFATDAVDDDRVPPAGVAKSVADLKAKGVDVKYARYPSGGHGYGLGTGTPAAGWLNDAVAFWEAHMKKSS
jgi:acetyl esterase/lipase